MKTLVVFDFDHTLIDENVDTWIMSVCPHLQIYENLRTLRNRFTCWTDLMDHTFCLIHEQGVKKAEVLGHVGQVRLFDQALKAVGAVESADNADTIILSDANVPFIEQIISECGVRHVFKEVISNPAHFDGAERLHIQHYHAHQCSTCVNSPNLCKGQVLTQYLERESGYDRVLYVGDGRGDYCPALRLTANDVLNDVLVCREGYTLSKLVAEKPCEAKTLTIDFVQCLGDTITECLTNC